MDILSAQGIVVGRAGQRLLDRVSLTLKPGERVAVLGANGAGKSTLLRCLAGELQPDQGWVQLAQQPLAHWYGAARAQRLAVMPQQINVNFPLTASEVVLLGRSPFRDEGQSLTALQTVMMALDCWHLRGRRFPTLSGGEQQRVQLARVLLQLWPIQEVEAHTSSRVLLLDECTSAQDPARQHQVLKWLQRVSQQGALGMIAVLHDLTLAASWAQRILLLKQGRVLVDGAVDLLTESNLLVQGFDLPEGLAARYAHQNADWLGSLVID